MKISRRRSQRTSRSSGSTNDALSAAFTLLKTRGRSEEELRERLLRKGFKETVIYDTISRLKEYGYINDKVLAVQIVEYGRRERHLGKRGLVSLLRKRRIPEETIKSLDIDEEPDRETASRLVNRKLKLLANLPAEKRWRRLYGYLSRRGYSSGLIREVMEDINKKTFNEEEI